MQAPAVEDRRPGEVFTRVAGIYVGFLLLPAVPDRVVPLDFTVVHDRLLALGDCACPLPTAWPRCLLASTKAASGHAPVVHRFRLIRATYPCTEKNQGGCQPWSPGIRAFPPVR